MLSDQGVALGYVCSAWNLAVLLLWYCRQTVFFVKLAAQLPHGPTCYWELAGFSARCRTGSPQELLMRTVR